MLTTDLTIDSTHVGSDTSTTPVAIDDTEDDVASYDRLQINITGVHTTEALGLVVTLGFQLP